MKILESFVSMNIWLARKRYKMWKPEVGWGRYADWPEITQIFFFLKGWSNILEQYEYLIKKKKVQNLELSSLCRLARNYWHIMHIVLPCNIRLALPFLWPNENHEVLFLFFPWLSFDFNNLFHQIFIIFTHYHSQSQSS